MLEQKDILRRVRAFLSREAPRIARLNGYYLGRQDILRPPRDPVKPDNRLVNAFCRNITDCTVGYFMGRGVRYDVSDPRTAAWLAAVADASDERFVNNALARDLSVCGRAAELLWYDAARGLPRFTPLPAGSVFPVWDGSVDPALLAAIRVYRPEDADGYTVEVYDGNAVTEFAFDGASLTERARREHFFGEVPVVFYDNNRDRQGDFETVLSLVDAYDRLQSASVNDFELFADSYLAISGMGATDEEDLARIRRDRVILLDDGGRAEWLTKQANDAYIENLKSRIAKDIYRFSGTVDMAEETLAGGTLSGVAIRYRLISFENRVSVTEQYFRRSLMRRWRLLSRLARAAGVPADAGTVRPIFQRNLPGLPEEAAELAKKLTGILSRRTVVEHLPLVENAEEELARIAQENEKGDPA